MNKLQISNTKEYQMAKFKISKLFALITALAFLFPQNSQAANTAEMYFTSAKPEYYVGEHIYIKLRVDPGQESINVVRAIFDYNTDLTDFVALDLDGAWPYGSPGSFNDETGGSVNQGGFILSDVIETDSQFLTLELLAQTPGVVTFNFDDQSLLVDPTMTNQLLASSLNNYSVTIIGGEEPPDEPPPSPTNQAPIINDLGEVVANIGDNIKIEVKATDPDDDNIALSVDSGPVGSTFNPSNGEFSWIPSQKGIYFVTFRATDDSPLGSKFSTKTVRVTVFCSSDSSDGSGDACPSEEEVAGLVTPICLNTPQDFTDSSANVYNPDIYSSSHPDQSKWYAENLVNLRWNKDPEALAYALSFNDQENEDPSTSYFLTTDSQITYREVGDGRWNFHLKIKYEDGWSKTYHYKVRIDSTAPRLIISDISKEQLVKVYFNATDLLSGLDRYEYKINGEWKSANSPLEILEEGELLTLRARDWAGNATQSQISLKTLAPVGDQQEYVILPTVYFMPASPHIDNMVTYKVVGRFFKSNIIILTGQSQPSATVNVFFTHDKSIFRSVTAGADGRWLATFDNDLGHGSYSVYAVAQKGNDLSARSNTLTFMLDKPLMKEMGVDWPTFVAGVLFTLLTMGFSLSSIRRYFHMKDEHSK
jgi:hypothetical protein